MNAQDPLLLLHSHPAEVAPTLMEDFHGFASVHWPRLVRTAYMMGCRPADAEDFAQSALTTVWKKWSRVVGADNPEAYAFRILINTVLKAQRRRWRAEEPAGDFFSTLEVDAPMVDHDTVLDLRGVLEMLPPAQRAVIVLRFLHDKSEAEIAEILNIPHGTVKSRSARGLETLRSNMNPEQPT